MTVAFNDLREWIDDLEERNDLTRVRAEVDWDEEIGAITREVSSQFGPALLFENIKDHQQQLLPPSVHQRHRHPRESVPFFRRARNDVLPRAGAGF